MLDVSHLGGIVPPLVTPLHSDESVDETGLRRLVQHVVRGGVHGVFAMGSTGEFAALADHERRHALEIVVDEVKGQVPVFAGIGDSSTRRALARVEEAQQVGVDALVAILPYYQSVNNMDEAKAHLEAIATTASVPVMLYNIPQRVGAALAVDAVSDLRDVGQIVGIKDSSEDFSHFQALLRLSSPAFRVFQGSEHHAAASLLMGAHGAVLGIANLAPKVCVSLYEAARDGNVEEVRELHRSLMDLNRIYWFEGSSPIGGLKAALEMIAICQAYPARPMTQPDTHARSRIEAEVKRFRDQM
ncbi:MAG: dihydrodipicolinate synthase family protein [Armatimonadota bacterium]|nr:MAG: dihydrodipicolinate synthase family protein [Armatimonadota bacterium]